MTKEKVLDVYPMVSEVLDQITQGGCDVPDCDHDHSTLYLEPRCHPGKGCNVIYYRGASIIHFECAKCAKPVASFHLPSAAAIDWSLMPFEGEKL